MNNTTTLPPRTPMPLPEEVAVGTSIRNTYIWVLVAVGLPGNLACLVTVLSMQVTTATFYVALLAAADSMALFLKLQLLQITRHGKLTKGACFFLFTPSFVSCYANWVLALICFERFFAVCFPLKKKMYFTKRRVYISVVVLAVALLFCFSPTPLFYPDVQSTGTRCVTTKNVTVINFRKSFYDVLLLSLYFFIPFLLIAVFITLIIVGLQRHRRARQRMNMAVSGGGAAVDGSAERSISLMLLGAGLVFLMLTLPACLYYLFLEKSFNLKVRDESAKAYLLYQVITMLGDVNHAVNFIIYFLSAAKFRKRFVELLKRCLCCLKSQGGTHSTHVGKSQADESPKTCTTPV